MRSLALQRARLVAFAPGLHRLLILSSVAASLVVSMLFMVLGLLAQLLVSRGSQEVPRDWVLGPWVSSEYVSWPFFGDRTRCLMLLIVVGAGLAVVLVLLRWLILRTSHRYAVHVVTHLRDAIYRQAMRLGPGELLRHSLMRPEQLAVDQADRVCRGLVAWWAAVPYCGLLLLVLMLISLLVNAWLTLLAILLVGYLFRLHRAVKRRVEADVQTWSTLADQRRASLQALLRFAPMASSLGMNTFPADPVEARLSDCQAAELRVKNSEGAIWPLVSVIALLSVGLLLLVVGLSEGVTVAGTVVLAVALGSSYFPAMRLLRMKREQDDADEAAREIFAYLDSEPVVRQAPSAHTLARLQREIRFDDVSLTSPVELGARDTPGDSEVARLLDHVSFEIPARKRIVILASDSQTPLALAGLLARLYDPTAGRILFDGQEIRSVALAAVREQAILVWRDSFLFTGSIATNISCADTRFSANQIRAAVARARATHFIQELPAGIETRVGLDGTPLSEDQAFRIALARALIREPSLLVIQEPVVVGEESEREVRDALAEAAESATVLTIPSRLATIRSADLVYVFHEGKLHARGPHAELLSSDELYRHLIYVRFNAFRRWIRSAEI